MHTLDVAVGDLDVYGVMAFGDDAGTPGESGAMDDRGVLDRGGTRAAWGLHEAYPTINGVVALNIGAVQARILGLHIDPVSGVAVDGAVFEIERGVPGDLDAVRAIV